MNIVLWLFLGGIAGTLAGLVMGQSPKSFLENIVIGTFGAALGGFLSSQLGLGAITALSLQSLLVSVAGACLLIMILSWIRKRIG